MKKPLHYLTMQAETGNETVQSFRPENVTNYTNTSQLGKNDRRLFKIKDNIPLYFAFKYL